MLLEGPSVPIKIKNLLRGALSLSLLLCCNQSFAASPPAYLHNFSVAVIAQKQAFKVTSDRLDGVTKIKPFTDSLQQYLTAFPQSPERSRELQRLYYYFHRTQRMIRSAQDGQFHEFVKTDPAFVPNSDQIRFSPGYLQIAKDYDLPLPNVRALAVVSFVSGNPNVKPSNLNYTIHHFWNLGLNYSNYADARGVTALFREIDNARFHYARALRQVNMQFLMRRRKLPVFDSLGYEPKPDLEKQAGLLPAQTLTTWYFFPYDEKSETYYDIDRFHPEIIDERVKVFDDELDHQKLFTVDIEHWPLDRDDQVHRFTTLNTETVEKYAQVLDQIRESNPSLLVCLYMVMPAREFNYAYQGPLSDGFKRWQKFNSLVARTLLPRVDALCPSVYTLHEQEELYPLFITANLGEAQRLAQGMGVTTDPSVSFKLKLPVIAYMWPRFHPNSGRNPYGRQFIPADFFRMQLDEVSRVADGIVLWDGPFKDEELPWQEQWPTESSWFSAFQQFQKDIGN